MLGSSGGSHELVDCTATNPELGAQTVFLQFVGRGRLSRAQGSPLGPSVGTE